MKKLLVILMVFAIVTFTFCGCTNDNGNTTPNGTTNDNNTMPNNDNNTDNNNNDNNNNNNGLLDITNTKLS